MAGLLEMFGALATPEVIGQISKATGVDASLLTKGISAVGATGLEGLAKSASTPEGADALMKSLPSDSATSGSPMDLLSGVLGSVNSGDGGTGADLMNQVLGSGSNAISGTLSKTLGFDVKPLMAVGTPMLMGLVSKLVKSDNLDAAGLSKALSTQTEEFKKDPANKEMSGIVDSAFAAGDKAATLRASFTDQEWGKLRKAPLAAIGLVMAASPSKGGGAAGELAAGTGAIVEAAGAADPTSLLSTAFGGGLTKAEIEGISQLSPTRESALASIKEGLAVVKQKDASAAQAYVAMISGAATATASATKEGGFLGIGGAQVSAEEQAALSEIQTALA